MSKEHLDIFQTTTGCPRCGSRRVVMRTRNGVHPGTGRGYMGSDVKERWHCQDCPAILTLTFTLADAEISPG